MLKIRTLAIVLSIAAIIFFSRAAAQDSQFVPMDDYYSLMVKFHSVDTVLVVFPSGNLITKADSAFITGFVFWGKQPHYLFKEEHSLKSSDYKMNIQLFGAYYLFSNKRLLEVPIEQCDAGFRVDTNVFSHPHDAFFYITDSATRFYTCKNTPEAPFPIRALVTGAYQLNVFNGYNYALNGFYSDVTGAKRLNSVSLFRNKYFKQPYSSRFFNVFISNDLGADSLKRSIAQEIDSFVLQLCSLLKCDTALVPTTNLYFYKNREELQLFLAQPLGNTMYGKSLGDANHIAGLNLSILKHEVGHTVIDNAIGLNPNPFWQEGFRQFSDYFFSTESLAKDQETISQNIQLLSSSLVSNSNGIYYNNWNHYAISGCFVKFVIDKIGFAQFKQQYIDGSIEKYILENYNLSMDDLIIEYKSSVL